MAGEGLPGDPGRAKRRAHDLLADEAGVRLDYHSGTTWGRRGQTPVVSSTGARFGANLISAIRARGRCASC